MHGCLAIVTSAADKACLDWLARHPRLSASELAVERLLLRVRSQGGEGRALPMALTDAQEERQIIEAFQAERADEYAEVISRAPAFLEEIAMERARGRDYFGAPGAEDAEAAIERCAEALAAFESEAFFVRRPRGAHSWRDWRAPAGCQRGLTVRLIGEMLGMRSLSTSALTPFIAV